MSHSAGLTNERIIRKLGGVGSLNDGLHVQGYTRHQERGRRKIPEGKAIEEWGKTWGKVIELPGEAVEAMGLTSRFASADIKRNC